VVPLGGHVRRLRSAAMATVTDDSSRSLSVAGWEADGEQDSKSERYLARRLAAAGADYKSVALITFLLAVAVAALAWLSLGAVIEHWIVPGGLPRWARWSWLGAIVAAVTVIGMRWIAPLLWYRVNLVYAARVIEKEHPDLHNDLVNAVLVKAHPESSPPMVVRSLERRAARQLSGVPAEGMVDRGPAVRLAAALAVLVAAACVYQLLAPKSLVTSLARLAAPWSSLMPPSRVQFSAPRLHWRLPGDDRDPGVPGALEGQRLAVEAGTATLVRGRQLALATDIRGLRRDERPTVQIMPIRDDGSIDPAAAPWQGGMDRRRAATGAGDTYVAVLPDAARGIDRPLAFTIVAGDARGEPIRIAVVDSPSLLVREVRYDYPPYTRLAPEAVPWQGDVRAVEGTRVTVIAESNRPIDTAWLEFDGSGGRDRGMKVGASDLARATVSFDLRMNADRSGPEHAAYRLAFRPRGPAGAKEDPVAEQMDHRIEVVADLGPEVAIEHPRESPLRVPVDAPVAVRVRAFDPDFGLAHVGLEVRFRDGRALPDVPLLAQEKEGAFTGSATIVPARLGAAAGAVIEYRAVAVDTRPDQPNIAHTAWQSLIVDPSALPPPPDPRPDPSRQRQEQAEGGESPQPGADRPKEDGGQEDGSQEDANQSAPKQAGNDQRGGQDSQKKQQAGQRQDHTPDQSPSSEPEGENKPGQQSGGSEGEQKGQRQSPSAGNAGRPQQQPNQQSGDGGKSEGKQSGAGKNQPQPAAGGRDGEQRQPGGQAQSGGQGQADQKRDTVAADGTNDGKAMERILEHRREQERGKQGQGKEGQGQREQGQAGQGEEGQEDQGQGQREPARTELQQNKDGRVGKVTQQQNQNPEGEVDQQQQQTGENNVQQNLKGEVGDVTQQQSQNQKGKIKQDQSQSGANSVQQELNAEAKNVTQEQEQQQAGEVEQRQVQASENGVQQKSKGRLDDVTQQEQQKQGGQIKQQQRQQNKTDQQQATNESNDDVSQQHKQDQRDRVDQQQGGGKGQNSVSQGSQGQTDQAQTATSQDQQAQKQQGQSIIGQSQQHQTQQGQTLVDQTQQSQTQQGQSLVSQSQQGLGKEAKGANGQQQNREGEPDQTENSGSRETEWVEQDSARARNAADLAIQHLRDSLAAGHSDVLERLGWTEAQARAFLERWEAMRRLAGSDDPRDRGEFERAIRSLGLRPDGVRISRDVPADAKGGQAEGRRSRPPSEYRDQLKAYLQGTSAE
jgi:hypothetical protein